MRRRISRRCRIGIRRTKMTSSWSRVLKKRRKATSQGQTSNQLRASSRSQVAWYLQNGQILLPLLSCGIQESHTLPLWLFRRTIKTSTPQSTHTRSQSLPLFKKKEKKAKVRVHSFKLWRSRSLHPLICQMWSNLSTWKNSLCQNQTPKSNQKLVSTSNSHQLLDLNNKA